VSDSRRDRSDAAATAKLRELQGENGRLAERLAVVERQLQGLLDDRAALLERLDDLERHLRGLLFERAEDRLVLEAVGARLDRIWQLTRGGDAEAPGAAGDPPTRQPAPPGGQAAGGAGRAAAGAPPAPRPAPRPLWGIEAAAAAAIPPAGRPAPLQTDKLVAGPAVQPFRPGLPVALTPAPETRGEVAPPPTPAGSYLLVAYPFGRFADLGQFQTALRAAAGVRDVRVRRFAQGVLELRLEYDGATPLTGVLRGLPLAVEEVEQEEPYRLRVRLRRTDGA